MKRIATLLSGNAETPLPEERQRAAAAALSERAGLEVYPVSISAAGGMLLALRRGERSKHLLLVGPPQRIAALTLPITERRELSADNEQLSAALVEPTHEAARFLSEHLTWTAPRLGGLACSVGLGDRTGLATPGHVRAVQGSGCFPYFAQQSIREMTRTRRTPEQVMDDAVWGVFQAGWREGFGSDADHLKTTKDLEACLAAGFTMFTFDPGDHVQAQADSSDTAALAAAFTQVPWADLETTLADYRRAYLGRAFPLQGGESLTFDEPAIVRAAVKYGPAVAHATRMYRHLARCRNGRAFEVEVSVDETPTPTTPAEHYLVAAELKRLGVTWVGLAPRFIGEFEKGIDYKGDLRAFERSFAQHAAIARTLGPYKLSIHSGSDKFSIYPLVARLAERAVHLKTAGTSYLEALRVAARCKPDLFRHILDFAFERFDEDRASYHISARREAILRPRDLLDEQLESVLDGNDGRQLLHVTFGSVLTAAKSDGRYLFRDELLQVLAAHEEEHYQVLAEHLGRHVRPFAK